MLRRVRRSLKQATTWGGMAAAAVGATIAANGLRAEGAGEAAAKAGEIAATVQQAVAGGAPWYVGLIMAIFGAAGMIVDTDKTE